MDMTESVRRHGFDPTKGFSHLGALEVAARYSRLDVDRNAFPLFANPKTAAQQATERAIGVTWYWNRYAKLLAYYEHTRFEMATANLSPLHSEDVLMEPSSARVLITPRRRTVGRPSGFRLRNSLRDPNVVGVDGEQWIFEAQRMEVSRCGPLVPEEAKFTP